MDLLIKGGTLLIAEPFMADSSFSRAVVLICEHNDVGTTGFIINRLMDVRINDLVPDFPKSKASVYYGGPVSTDSLHFIHNVGDMLEDSVEVCPGVFWGGNFEKLKFLMANEVINDENIKFFVGYSGWSAGQLKEEMIQPSWLTSEMDSNYLFKTRPYVLWQTVLHNMGDTYTVIAQMPEESMN
jgi:putative transcriptional regulator